jgi:hypothetical protein
MEFILMRRSTQPRIYMRSSRCSGADHGAFLMLDILFIAIGLAFLAATMLYAAACDRL